MPENRLRQVLDVLDIHAKISRDFGGGGGGGGWGGGGKGGYDRCGFNSRTIIARVMKFAVYKLNIDINFEFFFDRFKNRYKQMNALKDRSIFCEYSYERSL